MSDQDERDMTLYEVPYCSRFTFAIHGTEFIKTVTPCKVQLAGDSSYSTLTGAGDPDTYQHLPADTPVHVTNFRGIE